ncbi:MAG: glycosyltransferase family 2 protein [Nannocystaceae bacterium]
MVRIALATTAKNEADILRFNLQYHRELGIERCFVFLDGTTDATRSTIEDLPHVELRDSVAPRELGRPLRERPELAHIMRVHRSHHCARQMLNALWAIQRARALGFDWLVSIDADELLCPRLDEASPDALPRLLAGVEDGVDQLQFLPLEIAQSPLPMAGSVFAHAERFSCMFHRAEDGSFAVSSAPHERRVLDPATMETRLIKGYLGHREGKAAVRLSRPDLFPSSVHGFRGRQCSPLRQQCVGWLLHYNMFSPERFIRKHRAFAAHPDHFVLNDAPISWQLRVWRDFVNDPDISEDEMREYFRRWIAIPEREIERSMSTRPPRFLTVSAVSRVYSKLIG